MTGPVEAETLVGTADFARDLPFFTERLGMRLDAIWPADQPAVAILSGHGHRIRLEAGASSPGTVIRLRTDRPWQGWEPIMAAPGGGAAVEVHPMVEVLEPATTAHSFVVRRLADGAPWIIGRAGMHYRDLIPDRLGGSIIASHIRIPDGGPVPDMVHYHTVGFQLIFCYRGWVDLVYEDQGPPFRLQAGNCVIQPPEIRHRVLYASDNIEVIEIGVPAVHVTTIDHEMVLPNGTVNPERRFRGQRFVHHRAEEAAWTDHERSGFVCRDTTIAENTGGVAGVRVLRRGSGTPVAQAHGADIHFTFVTEGGMRLEAEGAAAVDLEAGDAFVLPPGRPATYAAPSDDVELLEVTLPGKT